ncbi:DnaB-like protein helicase-like protein [Sulfurimonas denitrificans DSM 1251]|uniref:DnaB-like protein helicase-like protein n=1 Tax=Sulfurimonas denitrificans (strain ATCC 33889 / DSM 1251) TaxID=326298 RepID=Q30SF0_SULDN|nr:DnaB-like helicase N-terminal domain-containing protein [Sulfurimonas denitrificans]ABB44081.1 DnaB-like protein helicase-like protein [Sulfurimonas denitrificans DSM 1251]
MNHEHNFNTSIEKSILSSILFEPQKLQDISNILNVEDFYLQAHQLIYDSMLKLNKQDLPIDEEFLKKKFPKIDDGVMLDILAANPISNILAYAKELKTDAINRQITLVGSKVAHGDLAAINELIGLQERLNTVDGIKQLKRDDKTFNSIFDKFDIDFEEIENVKFEYLMDNFLVKNEITMISARPGTGKSLLSVAAANMMLGQKNIEQVFYIDGDNSKSTLRDRNIHHLKKQHGNKFRYFVGLSKNELWQIINTLKKMDLTNYLVVFDSIKNFIAGDRDKNKDVSPVMEILRTLRNNGATVLFLHHQNKKQKDFESDYAGSSAFEEDTSNAFTLKRNDDKNSLILKPFKARAGDLQEIAFTYNAHNHTLTKLDIAYAKQTKEMDEMINETIEYLKSSRNKPMWSELQKNLTDLGFDKEKAAKVIKNNEGKLWNFERGDRNNQKLYFLIGAADKKAAAVETVYEDIVNTAPITPITPRSLFLGTSEGLALDTNKTDNSDKSSKTQNSEYIAPITPRTFKIGVYEGLNVVSDNSDNSDNRNVVSASQNFPREKIEMPIL